MKRTLRRPHLGVVGGLQLPDEPKKGMTDFFRYVSLIYGRQGIGKTTFGASFPDAILFSCERVSQAIECFDLNAENGGVKDWEVFKVGVKLLEDSPKRFKTVVIDTAEAAYQMCLRSVCKAAGFEHPGDDKRYGKTWDAVKNEFAAVIDRIWRTGRGIVFTAHSTEVEYTTHAGEEYTRIQPAVAGQAFKYLKAKTDCIFYAEYIKGSDGKVRRVLITEGDEVVEAKHAGKLPRYLPFPQKGGAELVARAYRGEQAGIPENEVRPAKITAENAALMIDRTRAVAIGATAKKRA